MNARDEIASALYLHQPTRSTGGSAGGARWLCSCGSTGLVNGTRRDADARARRHVADALLALPLLGRVRRVLELEEARTGGYAKHGPLCSGDGCHCVA